MKWECLDERVMFKETRDGLISNLDSLGATGAEGWGDGVAYGTVEVLLVFKRPVAGDTRNTG